MIHKLEQQTTVQKFVTMALLSNANRKLLKMALTIKQWKIFKPFIKQQFSH